MTKLKPGKLYKVLYSKHLWEINNANYIVSMTIPGWLKQIPEYIMYVGVKKTTYLSDTHMFLAPNLVYTFHDNFSKCLQELK